MLHGASAGDGLCLGVSLLYRDRNQPPPLFALVLFAPMYVDVGSTETFRDENVLLVQKVWRDGVQCELHVWPGAYHGFYELWPEAELSRKATKTRLV
ncbi:hypothetical protein MW887_008171 [Aspergillus wentii]|nr:hypothetical protein MW887_008171 [Aspergillus wentii]